MNLELRNIKYAAFASQETPCYSATLYIDGRRAGTVANQGHGGGDEQHLEPWVNLDEINAWLAANHPGLEIGEGESIPWDLELACGELLDEHLLMKQIDKDLRAKLLMEVEGKVLQWSRKQKGRDVTEQLRAALAQRYPGKPLLNDLPKPELIATYRRCGLLGE